MAQGSARLLVRSLAAHATLHSLADVERLAAGGSGLSADALLSILAHKVDAADKKYLDKYYGKCKVESKEEKKIKEIYRKIGLEELYQEYEEASYQTIMGLKGSCSQVPWAVIATFLKKVDKRK